MTDTIRLIYISEIDKDNFDSEVLKDILLTAKKKNKENDICGMLVFDYSHFLQVLEGDSKAVNDTYARIEKDKRHKNCELVSSAEIKNKKFEEWAMEYKELSALLPDSASAIKQMSHDEINQFVEKIQTH